MKNFITFIICAVLVFIGFQIILDKEIKCNIEYPEENIIDIVDREIGAITTIDATDKISDSRTTINDNFSYLDTNKISASSTQQTISDKLWMTNASTTNLTISGSLYGTTSPSELTIDSNVVYFGDHSMYFDTSNTSYGFNFAGEYGATAVSFGANDMGDYAVIDMSNITAERTYAFPDYSGTFAMASSTQQTISGNLWADLTGNADTCTTASAGDAAVDFFGAGVDAVTDATTCTNIEGTGLSITTSVLNWSASGIAGHDNFSDFVEAEHIDWTGDQGATNIHAGNYTDTNTTYLGGTNLTLADTTFNVDDAFIKNDGDVGTGVFDFGGATSFEIVNAAGPTVNAAGEIAIDTTSDQLIYYGGAKRVMPYFREMCFTLEDAADADDDVPIWSPHDNITITDVYCRTQGGTSTVVTISDGTNALEAITCDADGQADDGSIANGTFTANERMEFDIGTVTGSVDWTNVCITYTIDAD